MRNIAEFLQTKIEDGDTFFDIQNENGTLVQMFANNKKGVIQYKDGLYSVKLSPEGENCFSLFDVSKEDDSAICSMWVDVKLSKKSLTPTTICFSLAMGNDTYEVFANENTILGMEFAISKNAKSIAYILDRRDPFIKDSRCFVEYESEDDLLVISAIALFLCGGTMFLTDGTMLDTYCLIRYYTETLMRIIITENAEKSVSNSAIYKFTGKQIKELIPFLITHMVVPNYLTPYDDGVLISEQKTDEGFYTGLNPKDKLKNRVTDLYNMIGTELAHIGYPIGDKRNPPELTVQLQGTKFGNTAVFLKPSEPHFPVQSKYDN